jgi:hypothetical protein
MTGHVFERIERYNPALNAFPYQLGRRHDDHVRGFARSRGGWVRSTSGVRWLVLGQR